ncbi:hypothetical protein ACIP4S_13230 [Streptomyces chartreusis]|uniref:hypothetical protein n=1 Tax=Streptomyces chartreusis TaxID=1969 RepID=UPI0037FD86BF
MTDQISFGRPFVLRRDRDISGVSGTGIIADGILFPDGHAAIHWRGKWALTTPHPEGMDSILAIHDHGGQGDLHVIWADHDELRENVVASVVEAFDVPPEVCGTEAETAYLKTQIKRAVDEAWRAGATTHQWAERTRAEIVDAVMPFVAHLQDQRDRHLRAIGRTYRLAYTWQGAYGSANILVRAAGAELRDALDESGAAPAEVVHSVSNEQVGGLSGVDYPAAAECSAMTFLKAKVPLCIRAVRHRGDHIDEHGFHWSDTVAVYPVNDSQTPPNQGPLTGIEVRDPCPYCEGCPLIPRHLMDDHIREQHPDVTVASHANGSRAGTGGTEPAPCDAYEPPADTGFCARCGMFDHQHPSRLRVGAPGIPVPPVESEGAGLTPRQRAYKAVNEYVETLRRTPTTTRSARTAHIWLAVNRALEAVGHPADPSTQCRLPHEMEV